MAKLAGFFGIDTQNIDSKLSDKEENSTLVEMIKKTLIEDYKQQTPANL